MDERGFSWNREQKFAGVAFKRHTDFMVRISIRELHIKTGDWVKKAAYTGGIIIMERGWPVAKILPFAKEDQGIAFGNRILMPGFSDLPKTGHDSSEYIFEDRQRP